MSQKHSNVYKTITKPQVPLKQQSEGCPKREKARKSYRTRDVKRETVDLEGRANESPEQNFSALDP